ncbi:hypothetical protein D1872_296040 [compost metagenome]
MTEISPGMDKPEERIALAAPIAIVSEAANTAVISLFLFISRFVAVNPELGLYSQSSTREGS